jgi:hypothetical protein
MFGSFEPADVAERETGDAAMTGSEHYREAEQLLEHASAMLDTNVHSVDRAELLERQAVLVAMAHAHAALADAAVAGLSAHLDPADTRAWRQVSGTPFDT